jgi:hypothetical protein
MENKYLNEKYPLLLQVLTPLHIGAGFEKDWVEGADFVQQNGKVYKLDFRKVTKVIDANSLSVFLLQKNSDALIRKLPGNMQDYQESSFEMPWSSPNNIKVFIKNGLNNKAIVPGSSLKGAIRSILFKHLKDDSTMHKDEKNVFGKASVGDEFMRFIKISDAQVDANTELINTKIFNLYGRGSNYQGGWKHGSGNDTNGTFRHEGFNTIYEVLQPEARGFLSISLSPDGFGAVGRHSLYEKKKKLIEGGVKEIFCIINEHTKEHLEKEIAFFKKYQTNETEKIISVLTGLKNRIPDDNSECVLKMSAGSGFHSITGDWQYDDYDKTGTWERGRDEGKKKYKSRKLAVTDDDFYLMGFVALKVQTEEDIKLEKKRLEQIRLQNILEMEKAKAEEEERRREAEEEIRRKEKEKQEEELERKRKEEADRQAVEDRRIKMEQERKEQEARKVANKKEKEERKKQLTDKGIKELLAGVEDYEKGEEIIKSYKREVETIPETDFEVIGEFILSSVELNIMSKKQQKNWSNFKKGKWSLIRSWVGDKYAKQWYEKINI